MKALSKLTAAILTVAALFLTVNVKAQTTSANALRFSIGPDVGLPTGNATIGANFILGGTGRLQYGLSDNFAITLTGGGYHFFTKDMPGTNTTYPSYGVLPLKLGIKVFFVQSIYFSAEAGAGWEVSDTSFGPTKMILSPALGWANTHWDVGVEYENFSGEANTYGMVGLRVAYGFKL